MRVLVAWLFAAALLALSGRADAAWYEAKSKHFIIYANDNPKRLQTFAERLERFDQAVRFVRQMDDPQLTDSQRLQVFVVGSEEAVARLIGSDYARGMYRSGVSGSFAFVARTAGSSFEVWNVNTEEIFFHEYAHHLQLQYSELALPTWVIEGFAEFFATTEIGKDGRITIGKYPAYRVAALLTESSPTFEQIVGSTYKRLSPLQVNVLYGRAWLLMHYLNFDKSRKGQLGKYTEDIQNGMTALDAARDAFGNLKQFDRDLTRYMHGMLMGIVIKPGAISIGPVALRAIGPAEAAIMPVSIRSKRGVDDRTAPKVAADARKVAAAYPADPFVQSALAEAEYDAGKYSAADEAADRALAADPNNVHALIYKGRAQMMLGKASPRTAHWEGVRSWFIRANKIDTENAEPLMLYYRTFVEAGERPTKNAIDGLLYAVALAPKDEELRVNAVRQLLIDNHLAQAKSLFAPLAYQPHSSDQSSDLNAKVMAAISSGDAKAAISFIDEAGQPQKKR
jgi:tetratricopeptide (TPR) repeat protein